MSGRIDIFEIFGYIGAFLDQINLQPNGGTVRTFKSAIAFSAVLASCGGEPFSTAGSGDDGGWSGGAGISTGGSGDGGASAGSSHSGGSAGAGGDAGTTSGGSSGAGHSDATDDVPVDRDSTDAPDAPDTDGGKDVTSPDAALDAEPDAPDSGMADSSSDSDAEPDNECLVTGLYIRWHAMALSPLLEITGLHASIGTLPLVRDVCGPSDDLVPGDKHDYACCLRTEPAAGLSGSSLFFDFRLSDGKTGCTTSGCPLPLTQYDVLIEGVETPNLSVVLENPSCDVASGACQWVLRAEL
jgi:hypothetical protein